MNRYKRATIFTALLAAGIGHTCYAQSQYWTVDPSFSTPVLESSGGNGVVISHAYPGHRILVETSYSIIGGRFISSWLTRLNSDGSIDPSFFAAGGNGRLLAVYPDGRILFGTTLASGGGFAIKRMLSDGSEDPAFSSVQVNDSFASAMLLPDGSIFVVGSFSTVSGVSHPNVARVGANGGLDGNFASPFSAANASGVFINAFVPTADGQHFLVAGGLGLGSGLNTIARLNNDGTLDAGFNTGAIVFAHSPANIYPQADGGVVLADTAGSLVRLTTTGSQDSAFAPSLVGLATGFSQSQADGEIYYTTQTAASVIQLRRMTQDFSDDSAFQAISTPLNSSYQVGLPVVLDDGTLCVGPLTDIRKQTRILLTHVQADGSIDPSFNPRFSRPASASAHLRQADGGILVAGAFDGINGTPLAGVYGLARLRSDGSLDPSFNAALPAGSSISRLGIQPDGHILAFGSFPTGSASDASVVRFNHDGSSDSSFSPVLGSLLSPAVDQMGRVYGVAASGSSGLLRFQANGQPDPGFIAPASTVSAQFTMPLVDGHILVCCSLGGGHYSLLRLESDGTQDPGFAPFSLSAVVAAVGLPDSSALICTRDTIQDGETFWFLRHLRPDGVIDYTYSTHPQFGTLANIDIQLAIIGVLADAMTAASPASPADVWADFSNSSFRMTVDCRSDATFTRAETASAGDSFLVQYRRTGSTARSFDPGPFVLDLNTANLGIVPLNATLAPAVSAGGLSPFSCQWWHAGAALAGATQSSLPLGPVQAGDAGEYHVVISNSFGSATSSSFSITIDAMHSAPLIVTQPISQITTPGNAITFTVAASGTPAPAYQWYFNGNAIPGATGSSYTVTNAQTTDAGSYSASALNTISYAEGLWSGMAASQQAELKFSQSISFGGLANRPFSPSPITLNATSDSGLPVTFSVLSGAATVTETALTLTGTGTVTVRASQPGNSTFAPAPDVDRSFTVTGNFESWANAKFNSGELADVNVSGPNAIYGQDDLPNLVKYALGLEPKQNITTGLPAVTTTATDWVYTYTRPSDRTDITYDVEMSADLVTWTSAPNQQMVSSGGGNETWTASYPLASAPNVYFRLKVSQ
ncbi:MAG TPA: immunoglobulin domain-containing protein [Lacunisphaera sp.]|nr:immunoglobulin domain-containing protein [Lacunisphaera sp.]